MNWKLIITLINKLKFKLNKKKQKKNINKEKVKGII